MKISIFGMGYVGVVSAACLLRDGHHVCGVDTVEPKVKDLAEGLSPIRETNVPEYLAEGHAAGRLSATTDPAVGVSGADMVWICVGTPSDPDGGINLSHVETVLRQIGEAMLASDNYPLVVLRSTSLPGTTEGLAIPTIESATGKRVGEDFHVVFHPEFLREGTAVADFDDPPKIVAGEMTPGAADTLFEIYEKYPGPRFRLALGEAEMVKYCDNLFHALKLTFANEVAAIAKSVGVDSRKVAEVYCADRKLNISEKYLRPGFAYGGSCLPKDLRAILRFASVNALNLPMLQGVQESNLVQINRFVGRILQCEPSKVGMVGLSFKPNTDDMRESPYVKVAKALIGEGLDLAIYDPCVKPDQLIGANKEQVIRALKHLEELLVDSLSDLDDCGVIIVNHATIDAEQVTAWLAKGIEVMDVANISGVDRDQEGYEGIYW
ncbi:MAG: UDP-glucose/GDP-mannose dehydrogenase family protein [Verrucomicrobia bacterium]|nr:UDP-glucose/GDP-mannose dehydrogenase family protein [Verrucomicrobiota bacterium]